MKQLISFIMVGGTATLIQFLLLILFVDSLAINATLASACAFCLSAVVNYLLNYKLTFNSQQSHAVTLPKFCVTAALGLAFNTLFFIIGQYLLDHYLLAQCFATGITLVINFALHKFWIYRTKS